jgi:hypothetical protein
VNGGGGGLRAAAAAWRDEGVVGVTREGDAVADGVLG